MIKAFSGEYRWLSNFWLCPVVLGDHVYPSTENAYQAAKYPKEDRQQFTTCSPAKAKRLGREIELPSGWDVTKLMMMRRVLEQKFRANTFNAGLLVSTADQEIVEGNTWGDAFWGVCDGVGQNHLGRMLMDIRASLIQISEKQP